MARILVTDDSADIRTLIVRILNRDAHLVTEAADGEQAFHLLMTERFDIVVLDVMMPGLDGLTLCRMLRDTPGLGHLGILIISAASSEVAALAAGADAFLSKPFLPSRLLEIIRSFAISAPPLTIPNAARVGPPRRHRSQSQRSIRHSQTQDRQEHEHTDAQFSSPVPLSLDAASDRLTPSESPSLLERHPRGRPS